MIIAAVLIFLLTGQGTSFEGDFHLQNLHGRFGGHGEQRARSAERDSGGAYRNV